MNSLKTLLLFSILLTLSCNQENKNSELQKKVDALQLKVDSINNEKRAKEYKETHPAITYTTKYAFVVLTVSYRYDTYGSLNPEDKPGKVTSDWVKKYYTSKVIRFDIWNDDVKYKFIDDFQSESLRIKDHYYQGTNKRECFSFDTYEAASKAREKYVTEE